MSGLTAESPYADSLAGAARCEHDYPDHAMFAVLGGENCNQVVGWFVPQRLVKGRENEITSFLKENE